MLVVLVLESIWHAFLFLLQRTIRPMFSSRQTQVLLSCCCWGATVANSAQGRAVLSVLSHACQAVWVIRQASADH